jgi:hypothetical protein
MPKIPTLRVPRQEVQDFFSIQLQKGNNLFAYEMELDKGEKLYAAWDQQNTQALEQYFDLPDLAEEYNSTSSGYLSGQTDDLSRMRDFDFTLRAKIGWLEGFLNNRLASYKEPPPILPPASTALSIPDTKRVFIVYGHDEVNQLRLHKLLCDRFHLEPIVLANKAGRGRTLIEKFEQEAASCTFAFVLLTPDDQIVTPTGEYTQARPNVVFELGWFFGRLGRDRVTMLLKVGTQIHSDLAGISRIQFNDSIEEKVIDLETELRDAGLFS